MYSFTGGFYMSTKKIIGFVGLGLIGGSIAKAIRHYHPDWEIIAFDKNRETLALATQESVIDIALTSIGEQFGTCDYIFLCAPVAHNNAYLKQLRDYMKEHCILTDVGSVKSSIHKEIVALHMEESFIGGHPMTGSEKSGFINSKPELLENAYYILTPTAKVSKEKIEDYQELLQSFKALPIVMDAIEHDYVTGTISHLPHIIASTLVNFVKDHDSKTEPMKHLAAGGFKDITRIASSSATMWQHICLTNSEHLVSILDSYIESLEQTRIAIAEHAEQVIYDLFDSSKNYRNSIPDSSTGALKKAHVVYCDIIDETGGIATIATILASNSLSLKNIGIVHNREFEEGVLRIEFYDAQSSQKAAQLLQKYRYIVYER